MAVSMIETHWSWVYFADGQAFKRKKPVRRPEQDLSVPAARLAACREEVRLNARLAPDVYLGVIAVGPGGRLECVPDEAVAQPGPAIEWLVWMRRLPAVRMLDRRIAAGRVRPGDLDALVAMLVAFYRSAALPCPDGAAYLTGFERELTEAHRLLAAPDGLVPGAAEVIRRTGEALREGRAALLERIARQGLVDGHGDLRPEHVCLLRPPAVIDCLDFSAGLRRMDPFDELAFLTLECDRLGARWVGLRVLDGCAVELGAPPSALLHLYTALRAVVRARLAIGHRLDPRPRTPWRWPLQAADYLRRAGAALDALARGEPFSVPPPGRSR